MLTINFLWSIYVPNSKCLFTFFTKDRKWSQNLKGLRVRVTVSVRITISGGRDSGQMSQILAIL